MKSDGSVIIDTKISTDGMQEGFEQIKSGMDSVADAAQKTGNEINNSFAKFDASKTITSAVAKVKALQSELAQVNRALDYAAQAGQTETNSESVSRMVAQQEQLYERLEAARKKLSTEISLAANKQAAAEEKAAQRSAERQKKEAQKKAAAEEKAAQRSIRAAEKEAAATAKAAEKEARAREKEARRAMQAATKPARRFALRLREILSGALIFNAVSAAARNIVSYFNTALNASEEYREATARLKGALLTAFQPIYEYVLPAIIDLVNWLAKAVVSVGQFFAALSGKSYNKMKDNAEALYEQTSAIEGVGDASEKASKQLMGFDEINRLSDNASSATASDTTAPDFSFASGEAPEVVVNFVAELKDKVTTGFQAIIAKCKELIEPLRTIDFTPATDSVGRLGEAFINFASQIGENMEWSWFNVLVPLATWSIEEAAPASVDVLTEAMGLLNTVIKPVSDGMKQMYEYLKPIFSFIGDVAIRVLGSLREAFEKLTKKIQEKAPKIEGIFRGIGEIIAEVWEFIEPYAEIAMQLWEETFSYIADIVADTLGFVIDIIYGLVEFLAGVMTGDWERAWNGISGIFDSSMDYMIGLAKSVKSAFNSIFSGIAKIVTGIFKDVIVPGVKKSINGLIGLINGMVSGIVSGINAAIRAINRISIKIPDWLKNVPGASSFAGKTFGFNIRELTAPQIPYLAQGAVIPPNAPFMAVLGDQRNGTNIEAPADLIRQIVREELAGGAVNDETAALLRELIQVVMGIQVGDEVIGKAAARYNRRVSRAGGY